MANPGAVKKEKLDTKELDDILIEFCKAHPEGVDGKLLKSSRPDLNHEQSAKRLVELDKEGKLAMYYKGNKAFFKIREVARNVEGVKFEDEFEEAVYERVAASGTKGVWIKNLTDSVNIASQQCLTALKSLKAKGLVKEVRAGVGQHKVMYMLSDLPRDSEIIVRGGPWFNESNGEFDSAVADAILGLVLSLIQNKAMQAESDPSGPMTVRNKSYISPKEIHNFIQEHKNVFQFDLTVEHLQTVCNHFALGHSPSVVKKESANGPLYRLAQPLMESSGFSQIPCSFCPRMDECRPDAVISPVTCEYFEKWLKNAEMGDVTLTEEREAEVAEQI